MPMLGTGLVVYLVLLAAVVLWSVLSVVAVVRVRVRRSPVPKEHEPVSVLKPLCGIDQALEAALRTFFEQTHADYEIVFGIQDPGDPALAVARKLKAQYPGVACSIVVHDGQGMNPKVSNLRAMLTAVHHDLVVISDSNIAVHSNWLSEVAGEMAQPGVGLVFNLIAGVGERTLGATLENLELNGPIAAGMAVPTELLDHPAVVGKSMLFRRSAFDRLGGFESVASVLAEDYVIGRAFRAAGHAVRLAPTPVCNVSQTTSVRTFFARQLRWAMLRLRLQPFAYLLEPLTRPMLVALCAPLAGLPLCPALVVGFSLTLLRDGAIWWLLRGAAGMLPAMLLLPLRDALMLAAWLGAPWFRHVRWRGRRLRLSAGTRLYAERPLLATTLLRIEA